MSFPSFADQDPQPIDSRISDLEVTAGEDGARLDRFLSDALSDYSRARLQALIREGQVFSNGESIRDPSRRVKHAQRFRVIEPPPDDPVPKAQDIPLEVVFEDADLIVINKPAGLVVHPAAGNPDGTLVNALLAHCGESLSGIGGVRRPGIVHRLDKETSGVMVAAKTDLAHNGLAAQFAAHTLRRAYQALVWGTPNPLSGDIEGNIGRHPRNRQKMAVVGRLGKTALTHYRVLEPLASRQVSLVECRLATGRTHQVRVHMGHIGHPLLGDPVYGRKNIPPAFRNCLQGLDRQALHACEIGFIHPRTGEQLLFQSPLPDDIQTVLAALRRLS